MAARPSFTDEQYEIIWDAAERVFNKKFRGSKKAQVNFALALGLSQQSVSRLLNRDYKPSPRYVAEIAILDGKRSVEELVGPYVSVKPKGLPPPESAPLLLMARNAMKNLETCISFYEVKKHWSPWTLAAARAGFFGAEDFPAPDWPAKLDVLERLLEKGRKSA